MTLARTLTLLACLTLTATAARGQTNIPTTQPDGPNPWTHLNFANDPDTFHFAVLADRSYKPRAGVFEDAVRKLNLLRPDFAICVGDLIEGETHDPNQLRAEWDEFQAIVAKLDVPFFYVAGGHDYFDGNMADEWQKRFGRDYYHFVYKNCLFLALNPARGREGYLSDDQIEYVRQALADNPDVRWTFLFFHNPLWIEELHWKESGWEKLKPLLADRPHTIFAGHFHNYMKFERDGNKYFILSVTGGYAPKKDQDPGQFDQIAWVAMTPDGPRFSNLKLDGILDENVRTEGQAAVMMKMMLDPPVVAAPVFLTADALSSAKATLRVKAPLPLPVEFKAQIQPNPKLKIDPQTVEAKILPFGPKTFQFHLQADPPLPLSELGPIVIDWSLAAGSMNHKTTSRIEIRKPLACPPLDRAVTVDGQLDDWPQLPYACATGTHALPNKKVWQGPEDCSFRFNLAYDEDALYLAVEVTDDTLLVDPNRQPFLQDGLEIHLDARPADQRAFNPARQDSPSILQANLIPTLPFDPAAQNLPPAARAVCVKTPTGYTAELAIPRAYLSARHIADDHTFRLNVIAVDADHPVAGTIQLPWRPHWYLPNANNAEGTFILSNDTTHP